MDVEPDNDDKKVADIDREGAFMAPERVSLVTQYIRTLQSENLQ